MKKILSILFSIPYLLFSQSIYPLPFTFDDSNFFLTYVLIYEINITVNKTKHIGAVLNDAEHNSLIFDDKIIMYPACPQIKTLKEFMNYKNISEKCYIFIKNLNLSKNKDFSQIKLNNGIKIFVSETMVENNIMEITSWEANAIIFYDDKLLGILHYSSPFNNKEKFYLLLKTINLNKDTKKIDEYIDEGNRYIDKGFINLAMKNAFSALLLDYTNKNIEPLWQKIQNTQKRLIKFNEIDFEKLKE
jgi:hypothetical protein